MKLKTNIRKRLALALAAMVAVFAMSSCNGDSNELGGSYLGLDKYETEFPRQAAQQEVSIKGNVDNLSCLVKYPGSEWCSASIKGKTLLINVDKNDSSVPREAFITVSGGYTFRTVFKVKQNGQDINISDVGSDIKLPVKSASSVPSTFGEHAIDKTIDGNKTTYYLADYSGIAPIAEMHYEFENIDVMDYFVYYPADTLTEGQIKSVEMYVATVGDPSLTLYDTYDFQGYNLPSVVNFSPAIQNPTKIVFKVNTAVRSSVGCSEMEFYKRSASNFDYLSIFTDQTCSALKPGVTEATVNAIGNTFFRELALDILNGTYNSEFRIQEYKAWQHPDIMSTINKTGKYSLHDNPTGIWASADEEIVVFAGNLNGQVVSLFIQNPDSPKIGHGTYFPVTSGMNKVKATHEGLIYVMYHVMSNDMNAINSMPKIKINIVTGSVNGYFDSSKHGSADWSRLLTRASFKHFDLLGQYAHLTFETQAFKDYTPDGLALINQYDKLVRDEQEFFGLVKYNKAYNNRLRFVVMYRDYMHASSYYTGYHAGTQVELLNLQKFSSGSIWGPAHEVGHIHQIRWNFRWQGTTEVTNNILSLYIQTGWGNPSRLMEVVNGTNTYQKAVSELVNKNIPHNAASDSFIKLVPLWQLKLYMEDARGDADFYKRVFERLRNSTLTEASNGNQGEFQLDFIKIVCNEANMNLTSFFGSWGFLTPIDMTINDYTSKRFYVLQSWIDDTVAEIQAYPQPPHSNIYNITDDNVDSFR